METFLKDISYGLRMLVKKPGFTFVAVITLALGIGVNSALFTVFNAFVLRPLPLKDPGKLVSLEGVGPQGERQRLFSYLDYLDYRDQNTLGLLALILASVGLYGVMSFVVTQRTREIGIRVALGAQPVDVVRMFIRQGLRLTFIGMVGGIARSEERR